MRLLRTNAYPLTPTPTGSHLAGPGWEKLRASIAKSQFVLVGEDHGMALIPQFTREAAREQHSAKFITGIDRYQARYRTRLTSIPGLPMVHLKASQGFLSFSAGARNTSWPSSKTTGSAWQVFDLRPARSVLLNSELKLTDQRLVVLLLGHDYFVLIPTVTASRS